MRIVFFDIDTLRPDHMGCYGYGRNTSPHMDSVAAEGIRFDRYYCPNAPCLPSRASLVTGQYGIRTGVVGHGGTAADLRPLHRSLQRKLPFLAVPARRAVHRFRFLLRRASFVVVVQCRSERMPERRQSRQRNGGSGERAGSRLAGSARRGRQLDAPHPLLGSAHALPHAHGLRQSV